MKNKQNDAMANKIIQVAKKIVNENGIVDLTVSKILKELDITNRVFYNRFKNIDEVLAEVYKDIIIVIRKPIATEYDGKGDFFEYVLDIITKSLSISFDLKKKFNLYIFQNDTISQSNYEWYINRIKQLLAYARKNDLIKEFDDEEMSYTIWCACRGFNTDAIMRLDKEKGIAIFRNNFKYLLNGLKK